MKISKTCLGFVLVTACGAGEGGGGLGPASGGAPGSGGYVSSGGAFASGGALASGGTSPSGGAPSSGGAQPSGGTLASGGAASSGGAVSTGGIASSGGSTSSGGTGGSTSGMVNGCGSKVARNTQPFGCELAWGTNGNESNRADYLDFITTWIGYEHFQGRSGDCDGCGLATALKTKPARAVYYAYFAGYALPDCNVKPEGPNLCTDGAKWLRDNRDLYIDLYAEYALKTYQASPSKGVAWLLEGDFIQYTYAEQKSPFSMSELGALARDVVCAIKTNAPNALVGIDHSTWISNELMNSFWSAMPTDILDFVWTTGVGNNNGFMDAATNASSYNGTTARYSYLHQKTGLGILVDTSFGLSAAGDSWSNQNAATLNARASEGVMAINVTTAPGGYQSTLSTLRPQLGTTCQ